jgi:hypothetical protein
LVLTACATVAAGQTKPDGIDAAEVIKSIQEQIDYVAAQPLGDPPLALSNIEVDLTLVGEQTTGGGVTFKVLFFEIGGKAKVVQGVTTTTHLKLQPQKVRVFATGPPPLPFDKFLIEQLRQIKAGLRATSFVPESIDLSLEFAVKKEGGGGAGVKGFSFLGLVEVGGNVDAAALRQRLHKITLHFTKAK